MKVPLKKLAVIYKMLTGGGPRREVTGQAAKALIALYEAGERGCTAQEVAGWAYRFAAYVHILRRNFGLDIHMEAELHHGGWHGRYFLLTTIQIDEIHGL